MSTTKIISNPEGKHLVEEYKLQYTENEAGYVVLVDQENFEEFLEKYLKLFDNGYFVYD